MNNWSTLKRTWNLSLVTKLFKRSLKFISLAYIYLLLKFCGLMSCGSKDIFKNAPYYHHVLYATDLINMGWLKIQNIEYLENRTELFYKTKKIINLWLRWHILKSYCFVAEVTIFSPYLVFQWSVNYVFFTYNRKPGK